MHFGYTIVCVRAVKASPTFARRHVAPGDRGHDDVVTDATPAPLGVEVGLVTADAACVPTPGGPLVERCTPMD